MGTDVSMWGDVVTCGSSLGLLLFFSGIRKRS